MWSTLENTIGSTLCRSSVLGLSKRGFLVRSPTSLTRGGLCVYLVPTCCLVTPGPVLCVSALLTAHSVAHQTSLIKKVSELFETPWSVAHQAPLPMEFFRQEYWSGLPSPSPGGPPNPGSNPGLLQGRQILYHLSHQSHSPGDWKSQVMVVRSCGLQSL